MIQNTVLETHQQFNLFPPDETIILGVSGGADSIALLHIMAHLRDKLNIKLHVATLNHGLRDSATDDVRYVMTMCEQLHVPVTADLVDVHALSEIHNIGIEAAGRKARYDFFIRVAQANHTAIIATAHHADDQTETILLHLLRGTGTQGLVGMQVKAPLPDQPDFTLVRPLLNISRAEIEAYCAEHNLEPRQDETNTDTVFLRNAIRHDILPRLRQINPQIDRAFRQLTDIVAIEQDYMQAEFEAQIVPQLINDREAKRFQVALDTFQQWHPAMQRRAILYAATQLGAEAGYTHITQAVDVASKGDVGSIVHLPNNIRLRVGYGKINIEHENSPLPDYDYWLIEQEILVQISGQTNCGTWTLSTSTDKEVNAVAVLNINPDVGSVVLRTRQTGDTIQPLGMNGHSKTIKRLMIDRKIPRHLRSQIPLLLIDNQIAAIILPDQWIVSELFAVDTKSQYKVYFSITKNL